MAWRRSLLTALAVVACGAVLPSLPAQASMKPIPGPAGAYRAVIPEPFVHGHYVSTAQLGAQLTACEQRLTKARSDSGQHVPTVVIVGASFTAGVGPGNPDGSWAALLVRRMGWDAVVYGDPGAGYVRPGIHRQGPVARELSAVNLRALNPALVIIQAGHNDMGVPAALEQQRVKQAIAQIRATVPDAGIGLITVFTGRLRRPAAAQTDSEIVSAARAADPAVIIMDPLTGKWKYARIRDGLHPTAAGSAWIANEVAGILQSRGVHPVLTAARSGGPPDEKSDSMICDFGIHAPPAAQARPVIQLPTVTR